MDGEDVQHHRMGILIVVFGHKDRFSPPISGHRGLRCNYRMSASSFIPPLWMSYHEDDWS
jgi:hypothetical protein